MGVNASVKVMLSYNYCHFEVALSSDQQMTLIDVNEMRKSAMRLADEAVRQYQVAKERADKRISLRWDRERLVDDVKRIRELIPESEWTADHKAKVKALEDHAHWAQHNYDYEDEFEPDFR